MDEPTDDRDPATRVRQLLLSGDNIIKNRDNPERYARARERYVKARVIAADAQLDASVLSIIDLRLTELPDPAEGVA
jgi:vancomycin permeability regulator SanA